MMVYMVVMFLENCGDMQVHHTQHGDGDGLDGAVGGLADDHELVRGMVMVMVKVLLDVISRRNIFRSRPSSPSPRGG